MLNRATFEHRYAERSGITVEQLRVAGRGPLRCQCGDPSCSGWQMVSWAGASAEYELGRITLDELVELMESMPAVAVEAALHGVSAREYVLYALDNPQYAREALLS